MRSLKRYNTVNPWTDLGQGEFTVFRNYVKLSLEDASDFYNYGINPFYCYIYKLNCRNKNNNYLDRTAFCVSSVDDWGMSARFPYAMKREEATKLCREFMRSFSKSSRSFGGLTQKHFEEFFKEKGAEVCIG